MADTLIRPNSVHALAVVNAAGIPEEGDLNNPSAHLSLDADGNLRTSAVATIGGSVEISNDVGNPVPVSGTVSVTNFANPLPVTDNGGSLTVDGPLTDAQLRAAAVPISAVALPLPAGAATETTLALAATEIGATNESAAATDTSTSGINGLFKRLLQRITALLSVLPAALGQTTSANSLAVVLSSDQPSIPVSGTLTGTVSSVPNRPSQGAGRTHVNATISAASTDQTLYTVTVGKTLYVTTIILSAFNSSTSALGVIVLKDGGAGGTSKLSYLMQQAGLGALVASQPLVPGNNTFLEPLRFTTDVFMDITTGTVTFSVGIVGYEE